MDPPLAPPQLLSHSQLFSPYQQSGGAGGGYYGGHSHGHHHHQQQHPYGRGGGGGYGGRGGGGGYGGGRGGGYGDPSHYGGGRGGHHGDQTHGGYQQHGGYFPPGARGGGYGRSGGGGGGAPGSFVMPTSQGSAGNAAPPPPSTGTNIIIQVPSMVEAEVIAASGFICAPGNHPPLLSFVEQSVRNNTALFCFFFSVADQVVVARAQIASSIKPRVEIPPHLLAAAQYLPENWDFVARVSNVHVLSRAAVPWMPHLDMTDPTARESTQEQESIGGFARVVSRHMSFVMSAALAAAHSATQIATAAVGEFSVFRAYMDDDSLWYESVNPAIEAKHVHVDTLDRLFTDANVGSAAKDSLGALVFNRAIRQFGLPVVQKIVDSLTQQPGPFWEMLVSQAGSVLLSSIVSFATHAARSDLALLPLWGDSKTMASSTEATAANIMSALVSWALSNAVPNEQPTALAFVDAIIGSIASTNAAEHYANDLHASRVIQQLIARVVQVASAEGVHSAQCAHSKVIAQIVDIMPRLIVSPLGNYVASAVVNAATKAAGYTLATDATPASQRESITSRRAAAAQNTNTDYSRQQANQILLSVVGSIGPHIATLACNKFGSASLEKFVVSPPIVEQFVNYLASDRNSVIKLATDPFGNYFLQKVLAKLPAHKLVEFVQILAPVEAALQSGQYSKGVFFWLQRTRTQLVVTGALPHV